MSPDVKVLDDYLTNGSSNSVSDLKHNSNNSDSTHNNNNNNNPSCSIHLNPNQNGRTVRNSSPVSDNSQNISIVSLDENDADSSIASDSDFDDDFPPKDAQYIIEKLANGSKCSDQVHSDGVIIVSQNIREEAVAASRPQIGSIAVQNSSDITFGNKTFYQGPVTIKQFLLDNNSRWRPSGGQNDNPNFQNSNGNVNSSGLGEKKGSTSPNPKEPLTFKSILRKYKKYIVLNVVGLLLMLFIVIGLALAFRSGSSKENSGDADYNENHNKDSDIDEISPQPVSKLRLVTRSEWIAQPPNKQNPKLKIPINRVIITHTATEGCDKQSECVFRVRMIQSYHMDSKLWDDIGYNFLVGGDGSVYEGRGWHTQGSHTLHYNADSIGIAFIGTFTLKPPPKRQFDALKLILEEGVLTRNLTKDYTMYPHCAIMSTDSPGAKLVEVIKSWPHYIGKLNFDCTKNSSAK